MADLYSLDDAEYKMAHLDYMKNHCKEMLMIFENLLTSYDPAEMDADEWDCKLYYALEDLDVCIERMINRHWVRLGADGEEEWKQLVMECERKYHATFDVKSTEEVDLIVFDEEKCFDKEKEEVKAIFEDIKHAPSEASRTLLDTPIDL